MPTYHIRKSPGRFIAATLYFNNLDFSLVFTMIRKQKFYGVEETVSGELGEVVLDQSVQTRLYFYHLCVNLKLGLEQIQKSLACF